MWLCTAVVEVSDVVLRVEGGQSAWLEESLMKTKERSEEDRG